ncbi:Sensory neuron membrane protein 1 [Folsomia candida]|uniref:Sensory neuron membrane protein 1 n=1 Tax=Folsomia candida TaxID=158441 RepID=A0A226E045_FOLCA|nr:Sensory neuron membrane protein 1 [Folsomia candida]
MEKRTKISLCIAISGVVVLILGVILGWVVLPFVIKIMIDKEARLTNGTLIYDKWVDIPLPIHLHVYVWRVVNIDDYVGSNWTTKPILEEVGPYVYSEKRVKYEITPNVERDTVFFRQNITYTFVPELSIGPETDTVDVLNAPLLAVATILYTIPEKYLPLPHRSFMELLMGPLSGEKFIRKAVSVHDIVFGVRLNFIYDIILVLVELILGDYVTLPPELQNVGGRGWQFAPFVNKNGTNSDGLWEIYSGVRDNSMVNMIRTVNNNETIGNGKYWGTPECNKFRGGDGIFFPPYVEKTDRLAAYQHESEFRGISTYRFAATKDLFASPDEFPENECYCVTPREPLDPTCAPTGVVRLRSCKTGAPVVMSKPHFLDADESVINGVTGMKPEKEKHDTFLDIEPTLGVPLKGVRRIQVNVETQPFISMGEIFKTLPFSYIPFIWVGEGAELDDDLYNELKSMYLTPLKIANIGKWTAVGLGIAGTLGGAVALGYFTWWLKR